MQYQSVANAKLAGTHRILRIHFTLGLSHPKTRSNILDVRSVGSVVIRVVDADL